MHSATTNRGPSLPHSEWLNFNDRFNHLERLVQEREPGSRFRADLVPVRLIQNEAHAPPRDVASDSARSKGVCSRRSQGLGNWMATGEKKQMLICESDPLVEGYSHQPHTFQILSKNAQFQSYTPSLEVHGADGSTQIFDIKHDYADAVADTTYMKKLLVARLHYASLGHHMTIITEIEDLDHSIALTNARTIALCREDRLSTLDLLRMSTHLAHGDGRSTLGAVCQCVRGHPDEHPGISQRKALAAVARREISLDIHGSLLSLQTPVWALADRRFHH